MSYRIFEYDPYLLPFEKDITLRMKNYRAKRKELVGTKGKLIDFANGHEYFGFHKSSDGKSWYYREWAPAADNVYIMGDMNGWDKTGLRMNKLENGVFEIKLEGKNKLYHGCKVKAVVEKTDSSQKEFHFMRNVLFRTAKPMYGARKLLMKNSICGKTMVSSLKSNYIYMNVI